jgi:hypothetical protein
MAKDIIGERDEDQSSVQCEEDHFMICPVCRKTFDVRNLEQVMEHIHEGAEYPPKVMH